MASPKSSKPLPKHSPLVGALSKTLPKDSQFTAWHLSTVPAIVEALCYPPAVQSTPDTRPSKPLKTYCEKHFLAVSITNPTAKSSEEALVLGIEIYIYATAFSTTIFVAKADSTGYLYLQPSPSGFSPIRAITVAFIDFLVEHRRRPSKQLVINLFARAQSQYLFPGSVQNAKKHVLDDRGLIKWWCRVLDPLLEDQGKQKSTQDWERVHGYMVIPGLDQYETRAFVPRSSRASQNWSLGHPLELASPYTKDADGFGKDVPIRCLIPTFPDDPKARFVEELEDSTPLKEKLVGGWKTPRTIQQFWEMMAYRQECSSGRMTGFVWVVFEPPSEQSPGPNRLGNDGAVIPTPVTSVSVPSASDDTPSTPKKRKRSIASLATPTASPSKSAACHKLTPRKKKPKKLTGPIFTREAHIKTHHRIKYPKQNKTPYYYWPEAGRGRVVLDDNGYKRAVELLLHLEFRSLEQAVASTARWTTEVGIGESWGLVVKGEKLVEAKPTSVAANSGAVNVISAIKRKKDVDEPKEDNTVKTLGSGLVRKKAKVVDGAPAVEKGDNEATVNTLGAGLVRKKVKAS
ncbi:hypothetical protein F5Y18DRAFT_358577 [Xylariaceae sp. FL1019]|nr:hypothetical protein F5Y18DRAFT_358577 [Xylariaceae sp. FL1019]